MQFEWVIQISMRAHESLQSERSTECDRQAFLALQISDRHVTSQLHVQQRLRHPRFDGKFAAASRKSLYFKGPQTDKWGRC